MYFMCEFCIIYSITVICYCMIMYIGIFFHCFFFFKQKTAYDMRISDWSSDVCSSDLLATLARRIAADHRATRDLGPDSLRTALVELLVELPAYRSYADAQGCGAADADMLAGAAERAARHPFIEDRRPVDFLSSEERRLGQVGGDTGRFRWSSYL